MIATGLVQAPHAGLGVVAEALAALFHGRFDRQPFAPVKAFVYSSILARMKAGAAGARVEAFFAR